MGLGPDTSLSDTPPVTTSGLVLFAKRRNSMVHNWGTRYLNRQEAFTHEIETTDQTIRFSERRSFFSSNLQDGVNPGEGHVSGDLLDR